MRQRIPLNRDWEFTENCSDSFIRGGLMTVAQVNLPHTVRETPLNYFDESVYQMICGYRRTLTLRDLSPGQRVFLRVGAAAHSAEIYLDGVRIGSHKGGYTAFTVELTDRLQAKKPALLAIRVDSRERQNIPPFGNVIDYMTYGGLYREVWLEITEDRYIKSVFAVPQVPAEVDTSGMTPDEIAGVAFEGKINCKLRIEDIGKLTVRQQIYDKGCESADPIAERSYQKGDICELVVPGAKLWDVCSPALYTLRTELLDGETVIDRVDSTVGFRRSEFRADGYYLNGRKLKLRGLNRHQSYPYVGYAMPSSMQRYDVDILKNELGLNAVRTSHYPQSQHFIDRCDELGLLVFTEIPGWQYVGDDDWKSVAVRTTQEMVLQYRNHPSVILWGVRINESQDDDAFYTRTNAAAHKLDPTRPTGGVRYIKRSSLLEDVYTYNDFIHNGSAPGCEPKRNVTSDMNKPYLITEYCGHMYPTKSFDHEEIRVEHALRHARVLDDVSAQEDIAGSFGWCFFDYNTHRDFGSGDRVCYHGVCDMFRSKKLAASVYASQQDEKPVLEISSSMDIGEHPASVRGRIYAFTNADSIRFYQNDRYICEIESRSSDYPHLSHPPVEIDDFVGDRIAEGEAFSKQQARYTKDVLNDSTRYGMNDLSLNAKAKAAWLMTRYHMSYEDAYRLYGKYIENWGDSASVYRFEAIRNGEVVLVSEKAPFLSGHLEATVSHTALVEGDTYDVAAVRLRALDQNGNTMTFYSGCVTAELTGDARLIGPSSFTLPGGTGGLYIKTIGKAGSAVLTLTAPGMEPLVIRFSIAVDL